MSFKLHYFEQKFNLVLDKIDQLIEKVDTMSQSLDTLTTEVTEAKDVMGSALVLITGLAAKVAEIQAQLALQSVSNDALDALAADLDTSANALAAAVVANTPAEPPVEPAP